MNFPLRKGIDFTGVTVVFFCHDGQGNFVMNKRSQNCRDEQGRWDIGGGAVEFDESVEECLKKEIMEEYCTTIKDIEFLGYREMHREHDGQKTHWIGLDFKVLIDREKVAIGEPHKMEEIGWFTLDNLPDPMHSQAPFFLEKYKEKLLSK
jgi:8-oxo-dGTP diphosphatase